MLRRLVVTGSAIAASLIVAGSAAAQTGVLSGTVVGTAARTPLVGATVTVVGSTLSAVTDSTGRFTIANVPAGDVELRVRRVEFYPLADRVRIAAGDTTRADYQLLHPDDERLNREASREPRANVEIMADSAVISFGAKEARRPLIIVDGVIMSPSYDIKEFDANRIESIEVVKGEVAKGMYGTRAGDGVISIRTRGAPLPPPPPRPPVEEQSPTRRYFRIF